LTSLKRSKILNTRSGCLFKMWGGKGRVAVGCSHGGAWRGQVVDSKMVVAKRRFSCSATKMYMYKLFGKLRKLGTKVVILSYIVNWLMPLCIDICALSPERSMLFPIFAWIHMLASGVMCKQLMKSIALFLEHSERVCYDNQHPNSKFKYYSSCIECFLCRCFLCDIS